MSVPNESDLVDASAADAGGPSIIRLTYAPDPGGGGTIVASMASTPSTTVTGALFQGDPSGQSWMATATNTGSIVRIQIAGGKLASGYVYKVALTTTPSNPVWGPAVTLVWEPLAMPPGDRREPAMHVSLMAATSAGSLVFRGRAPERS